MTIAANTDFDLEQNPAVGPVVAYAHRERAHVDSLPPGGGLEFTFPATAGRIEIRVVALNAAAPTTFEVVGAAPGGPGNVNPGNIELSGLGTGIEHFNHVAVEIRLTLAGKEIGAFVETAGLSLNEEVVHESRIDGPGTTSVGTVTCRVINKASVRASVDVQVRSIIHRERVLTRAIPHVLFNRTFRVVLEALRPSVSVFDGDLLVGFSDELRQIVGDTSTLQPRRFSKKDDGVTFTSGARLLSFDATVCEGQKILVELQGYLSRLEDALDGALAVVAGLEATFSEASSAIVLRDVLEEFRRLDASVLAAERALLLLPELSDPREAALRALRARISGALGAGPVFGGEVLRISALREDVQAARPVIERLREASLAFRGTLTRRFLPDAPSIILRVGLSDVSFNFAESLKVFELKGSGVIEQVTINLYLTFGQNLAAGEFMATTPARFDGALIEVAVQLGFKDPAERVIVEALTERLGPAMGSIGTFLAEVLAYLVRANSMFLGVSSDETAWHVRHAPLPPVKTLVGSHADPFAGGTPSNEAPKKDSDAPEAVTPSGQVLKAKSPIGIGQFAPGSPAGIFGGPKLPPPAGAGASATTLLSGTTSQTPNNGLLLDPERPVGGQVSPEIPPEFIIGDADDLARLDEIQTIVVLMMENRSFDHVLGHLRERRGGAVEGFSGTEENVVKNRVDPIRMDFARDVIARGAPDAGVNILQVPVPVQHRSDHVARQIAEGAMSGFAQDLEDSHPGKADMAMCFYTEQELPVYYRVADEYAVCDNWYAAHPGPTWPNRWATLCGTTPELDNPSIFDPRIPYLPQKTIFSLLSEVGIDWKVFESDLSLVRTFDEHRLDTTHVVPLDLFGVRSDVRDFASICREGKLPPVVFVEPNFSDIPPIATANDDLAPTSMGPGQRFVATLFNCLTSSPQWERMLFVITYDEHGGFFDHKPPPGTRLGPPEAIGTIPRIHPQGPDHLGVRVPALVISPWVNAGRVSHVRFDHTAIMKSILLRHRDKIPPSSLVQFGPRVNQSAHLGQVLDRTLARSEKPEPFLEEELSALGSSVPGLVGLADPEAFGASLMRAFLPRPA